MTREQVATTSSRAASRVRGKLLVLVLVFEAVGSVAAEELQRLIDDGEEVEAQT